MSRDIFREIVSRSRSRGASEVLGRSRGRSDADDLQLQENMYRSHCRSSASSAMATGITTSFEEDDAFMQSSSEVVVNRGALGGGSSEPGPSGERMETPRRPRPQRAKSDSAGDVPPETGEGFDPQIKFNNFVLDSRL